ncbi:hypothetical protein [Arsenophonus nasoniae]|uniref:Uncharacterized protein n=1 Tax=Arsenophonus nasoniae TaxID=638 RepID=A0AA95GS62_9GAMM|nr:hypothetical protein [Arsenophonus nasoniae]WGM01784.1 hypothetical protein QE210_01250 [Arsenophonus nasoniae]
MIEFDIENDLNRIIKLTGITGMDVYPLQLPSCHLEGVIYQRISDPKVMTGLAKTKLVQARFQVRVQSEDYLSALKLSDKIRDEWEAIEHGYIGNYPVQTVQRGNLIQGREEQPKNRTLYWVIRDFILTYAENAK